MKFILSAALLTAMLAGCAGLSPYAGEQGRGIKALSEREVRDYLSGAGMGYARAAELNGYPGPMHVLELVDQLALTPAQRDAMQTLMNNHKADARNLGKLVVEREQELDRLFADAQADKARVEAATRSAAEALAQYRASHLTTHIAAAAILTAEQRDKYSVLRGYR